MIRIIVIFLLFSYSLPGQGYLDHLKKNTTSLGFQFLAGAGDGGMNVLQFKYNRSIFPGPGEKGHGYWNPQISWERKYHVGYPLSESALVRFTDGWHLIKGFGNDFNRFSIMSYEKPTKKVYYVFDFLIYTTVRSLGWHAANKVLIIR